MSIDNGAPQADGLSSLRDEAACASSPEASIPSARPARNAPAVRAAAVLSLAADCAEWGDDNSVEMWVSILRDAHLTDNGFEIARELDRYHRVNGVDAELVEILDGASHHMWRAHDAAVAAWVASEGVAPSLPVGARIMVGRHGTGSISDIKEEAGCYLFVPDGEGERFSGGGGIYVPYETAQGIEAASADETHSGSAVGESPVGNADAPALDPRLHTSKGI